MKTTVFLRYMTLFACISLYFSLVSKVFAEADNLKMLDLVIMSDDHDISDRNNYEDKMIRIAEKYGMKIERSFNVNKFLAGDKALSNIVRINVWDMPADALTKLNKDSEYQSLADYRDSVHNMKALSVFLSKPDSIGGEAENMVSDIDQTKLNNFYL